MKLRNKKIKVALVHDYLKEYGGAERVLEALWEIYPTASLYTLVYCPKYLGPHKERFKNRDIRPLLPCWLPFASKLISPLRVVAPILFSRLDLTGYDLVIVSSTGAYNPNLVKTKPQTHFCYCHTPPRYLYGLPTARNWKRRWWIRIPAEIVNHFLRLVDYTSAQKVDFYIANSKNTRARIAKFYRRDAEVIYPPVDIPKVSIETHLRGVLDRTPRYYLAGGRLARPKRIDLAIKACNKLKLPLKIYGKMFAGYGKELKKIAGPTIEFLGEVDDERLAQLYAGCLAFIFPAEEEDFGIAPVEALSYGKPVIALRQGGVRESIIEGKTGEFFEEPSVESLVSVLRKFKPEKYNPEDCRRQARRFSKERFKKEIVAFIESHGFKLS